MTDALGAHRLRIGAEVDVGVQGRASLVMRALTEEIIQFAVGARAPQAYRASAPPAAPFFWGGGATNDERRTTHDDINKVTTDGGRREGMSEGMEKNDFHLRKRGAHAGRTKRESATHPSTPSSTPPGSLGRQYNNGIGAIDPSTSVDPTGPAVILIFASTGQSYIASSPPPSHPMSM